MDIAAGTIGFVGFALGSTKTIHDTIVGIRNGPEVLRRLSNALSSMNEILHQIQAQGSSASQNTKLVGKVKEYCKDIQKWEENIKRIQKVEQDGRGRRFWRLVKTYLQEKDLNRMHELVQLWITELSLHFSVAGR